jgi:hypothetical protein
MLSSQPDQISQSNVSGQNGRPIEADYSAKLATNNQSRAKLTSQRASRLTSQSRQESKAKVVDLAAVKAKLTSQSTADFDRSQWKKSRIKPGYLIRRREGYNIVESEYGVQYLFAISRKPDRTSGDYSVHPFAGFFNWKSLEGAGLFVKERKDAKRQTSNE